MHVASDIPVSDLLLQVRGLRKRFGSLPVLEGVDLVIGPGEVVALVGENGAGKSTLAKCIARTLSADAGTVTFDGIPLGSDPVSAEAAGIVVVWQDLALCDNLDVTANLFLGREGRRTFLRRASLEGEAKRIIARLGIAIDPAAPVASLSGGERQAIAIGRALERHPKLLILDEPTASLGVTESATVARLIREVRDAGTAVLLISHRLEQVFDLANRIAVLRAGRVTAQVSPLEVHPDDVVAMISGVETESTARRQLGRLRSLVEQLSAVKPAASLPLIISAMAVALGHEQLCVHLLDPDDAGRRLRRTAAVGLPDSLLALNAELPFGPAGGAVGLAAASGNVVVVEDVRADPAGADYRLTAREAGIQSTWAAPIVGRHGVLGTISGYGETVGRPHADQLELVTLYAGHAATVIEREQILVEAQQRNRLLETIRTVLESLAGPGEVDAGLEAALGALVAAAGADDAAVFQRLPEGLVRRPLGSVACINDELAEAAREELDGRAERVRTAGRDLVLVVPVNTATEPAAAVVVRWSDAAAVDPESYGIVNDIARSISLALEREAAELALREAQTIGRTQRLQRDFLSRLSHELRTPLTTIQGCADSLRLQDVEWDGAAQQRFLDTIATESNRMGRLVADLLDVSAIDSGILVTHPDWCDLALVLNTSVACVDPAAFERVRIDVSADIGPIWADHDRLEQVFVNLVDNALRHTDQFTKVSVVAELAHHGREVEIRVSDDGPGIPAELVEQIFEPHVRHGVTGGTGLGLGIARAIARAHHGELVVEPATIGATLLVTLPCEADAEVIDE